MIPTKIYKLEYERLDAKDRFKFNIFIIFFMVSIGLISFMMHSCFSTQKILQTTSISDNYFGALAKQNVNKFQIKKILSEQKILDEIENRISKLERHVDNLRIVLRNMQIKTVNKNNCPTNC